MMIMVKRLNIYKINFQILISLVITKNSNFENNLLAGVEEIICLCVDKPGYSGQVYQESMDEIVKYIDLKVV